MIEEFCTPTNEVAELLLWFQWAHPFIFSILIVALVMFLWSWLTIPYKLNEIASELKKFNSKNSQKST